MQLLFDFFPILAFFTAYKFYGIYVATGVIIVASVLQIAVHWYRTHSINKMHVVSAVLIIIFGGITLYLQNRLYIQLKPSILYWLFAAVFFGSQYFGDKPVIKRIMDHAIEMNAKAWRTLNMMWVGFFFIMGFVNLYVVYNYDENTWVNFKLFGFLGLTFLFALLQGVWMNSKVRLKDNNKSDGDEPPEENEPEQEI
jgi:intracellular septation protein